MENTKAAIQANISRWFPSLTDFSEKSEIAYGQLHKVIHGTTAMTDATLRKVMRAMPPQARRDILIARMRDFASTDYEHLVLEDEKGTPILRRDVIADFKGAWEPTDPELNSCIRWLARAAAGDKDMRQVLYTLCGRSGWEYKRGRPGGKS